MPVNKTNSKPDVLKDIDFQLKYELQNYTYRGGFINWSMQKVLFVRK